MDIGRIIKDANSAPTKKPLQDYNEAVATLRDKGYSWREIAAFLTERGVKTDHTKLYRMFKKTKSPKGKTMKPVTKEKYIEALSAIEITDNQKAMLKAHYDALNRSITYTELAQAAGYDSHEPANRQYGELSKNIGEYVGFDFVDSTSRPGEKFHGSAIGMGNPYTTGEFQLVMHHELAKAIEYSGMFE